MNVPKTHVPKTNSVQIPQAVLHAHRAHIILCRRRLLERVLGCVKASQNAAEQLRHVNANAKIKILSLKEIAQSAKLGENRVDDGKQRELRVLTVCQGVSLILAATK